MAEPSLWGSAFSLPSVIGLPRMTPLSNGTFLVLGKTGTYPAFTLTAWIYNADGSLEARQDLDVPDHEVPGVYGDLEIPAIDPMAVELPDGRIAITWTVNTPSSGNTYVAPWMCIYSADLTPIGLTKPVFDPVSGARDYAESIVALDDGTLVISARNEKDSHAYLRVFSPDGMRSAALDLGSAGGSMPGIALTDVAALANGNVAVVVREDTSSLKGYVLTPSGVGGPALSTPFSISTSPSPIKEEIKVTGLEGGGFVVTWMEQGPDGSPDFNAFFRIYKPDGTPLSDGKPVSTLGFPDLLSAGHSNVLSLPGGGFAVAYEKATGHVGGVPGFEVHLATFDEHGARVSDDLRVSQEATTASIDLHELHLLADGRIVVRHSQGVQIVDPRDKAVSLAGTPRDDQYIGTSFNDGMNGGDGADSLVGAAGNDMLNGGGDNDTLFGDSGADHLNGGSGIDFISFANAKTGVTAGLSSGSGGDAAGDVYTGIEGLLGSSFRDALTGNGSAILMGRRGNDSYYVRSRDSVRESAGEGQDTVIARGSYTLRSDADIEVLKLSGVSAKKSASLTGSDTANEIIGHAGTNRLKGQGGDDALKASSGNDRLYGGSGDDTIWGGSGNDKLYGQSGRDVFVFDKKPASTKNVGRIVDFSSKYDSIYLADKVFRKIGSGSEKKPKKLKKAFFEVGSEADDRNDHIIYDKKKGVLYYDADGTGSKEQVKIATLSNKATLKYHDVFII
ncbi:calcium-binding protein [Microvirga roseola]|uniref:calcium-binding protein n=1 Tax=Microvirga roseola TaxID=2883126 RepID=UPI001E51149A|nr:calcium-binding protein [Microvirga roseola]